MGKKRSWSGLGELQTEVMEMVWDQGEATVTQVHKKILQRREITYTTVLVAMQKLEKKGWLAHRREGRAYVFLARRSREEVCGSLLQDVLKHAFFGRPGLLVSQLLDGQPMSDSDLADLRKLIDDHQKDRRGE
ncbi:MAG: BlaI/MecI/CopY family transcriptional regulator [Planctomycetes bacterium]|nr:BlaI/MecI/CopY family transcriptional regulator [Planctomycetota bacterium]